MLGTRDHRFTVDMIRPLYDAAAGPKRFWQIEGADHGVGVGIPESAGLDVYFDRIESFLDAAAPACLGR
ncbi:MAG: hypothetical protein JXR83_17955 [Deltaproteobacteria bacterium]|nr:hypothetical protein [Deltaproteobacteria bacterium]